MDSSTPNSAQNAEQDINNTQTSPTVDGDTGPLNEYDQADYDRAKTFKDGQKLRFVRVRFPGINRSLPYYIGDNDYPQGTRVLAVSEKGVSVGFVNSLPYEHRFNPNMLPVRSVIKVASAEDAAVDLEKFRQERRLRELCDRAIERNKLDMTLTEVEITQLGKKAIFHFTAPTRVDFRGLVHELVGELKMRIELRQISVRDRSAAVGGLGPCGRELCCSSFLAKYGNVGIKLAKNQDLSLNSSKINGVCGQLKCCLTYEDEVYQEKRKHLPRENAVVKTKDGHAGKVTRLHILTEQFETISPEGVIRRYVADMWDGPAPAVTIPKYFENGITDNSKTVIGLDALTAQRAQEHESFVQEAKARAKSYADDIFKELFGEKSLNYSLPEVAESPESLARKVLTPDEEEEIVYTPPEDELDEDGDDAEETEDADEGEALEASDDADENEESADDEDDAPAPAPAKPTRVERMAQTPPQRIHERPRQTGPRPPQEQRAPQEQRSQQEQRPPGSNEGRRRRRGGRGRGPGGGGGGGRPGPGR